MSKIYSQASEVLVWLGAAEVKMTDDDDERGDERRREREWEEDQAMKFMRTWMHSGRQDFAICDDVISGFNSLCNRKYWTRMWIVQEIALAKTGRVQSRYATRSLKDFFDLLEFYVSLNNDEGRPIISKLSGHGPGIVAG